MSQTCVLVLKNASIAYIQTLVIFVLGTPRVDLFKDSENVNVWPVCVLSTGKDPYGVFLTSPLLVVISKTNSTTPWLPGSS